MDKANWKLAFLVAFVALITIHGSAFADGVVFTRHTVTVPLWIEDKLRDILTENNRTGTFAVTDISYRNDLYLVSIAQLPDGTSDDWRLDQAIDLFVVVLNDTVGAVQGSEQFEALTAGIFGDIPPEPDRAWGDIGGNGLEDTGLPMLPFKPGTYVYIGPAGVHNAGYSTNWIAIDLVSGPDLGTNMNPNEVWAAKTEEITYVCRDAHSVAIKTDTFIYAHLADNTFLQVGNNLTRGTKFASLVTGSFADTCGWASQQPAHYHLHFGFQGNEQVKFSGWTFFSYSGVFSNGTETVGKGDKLYNPGVTGDNYAVTDPYKEIKQGGSFWDGVVGGFVDYVSGAINQFPERSGSNYQDIFVSTAGAVLRIFFVILSSGFNLNIFAGVMMMMFILEPTRLIYKLWVAIKKAIPFAG